MSQLIAALLALVTVFSITVPADAQLASPGLIGGLTALPHTDPSTWPDTIVNGGFEGTQVLSAQGGPWTPANGFTAAFSVDKTSAAHGGTQSMKMSGVAGAEAYEVFHLSPGFYSFSGYIRTSAGGSGRARLMLDLRTGRYESVSASCTADCGINSWFTSQEIPAGAGWTLVSVSFTITDADVAAAKPNPAFPGTIKAFAVLDGYWASAQLSAWYDDVQLRQQPGFPLDVFMRYPNYRGMLFSDQSQTLRFHVTPGAQYIGTGHTLRATLVRDDGSATMLETVDTSLASGAMDPDTGKPGFTMSLNTTGALGGVATMQPVLAQFVLLDGGGREVLPRYPAYRVYKVDAAVRPMMNISFTADNAVMLGIPRPNLPSQLGLGAPAPRFLLGVYDSALGAVDAGTNWEQLLFDPAGARRMSGLPINLYLNYHLGDTGADVINSLMTTLNAHKIAYLQTGNCFASSPASGHNAPTGFKIDQAGDGTFPYITKPNPQGIGDMVGGYYTADECTADMVEGVFAQYQRLVQRDPDSLTFGALLGGNDLPLWRDALDVMSTDPYPLYGAEPAGGYNHGQVATWTRLTAQAVQHSRPVVTVLQFFKFDASRSSQGRWPTQREMRNHAYTAIVEGAKGLMWWSLGENGLLAACGKKPGWCAERTQRMNDLKAVVTDIAALESVLLSPDVTSWGGGVAAVKNNGTNASLPASSIRTLVKHDAASNTDYLIAYNTTPYYNASVASPSVTVQFTLPAPPATAIVVHGENRNLAAAATLTDTFGPFEAHVYILKY